MSTSHPPCCPEGSWGTPLRTPTTKSSNNGRVTIGLRDDLELYIAEPDTIDPTSIEKAILVFTDVYGFQSRLFAICDELAVDLGCRVVVMDNFRGETMDDHRDDFFEWTGRHPYACDEKEEKNVHPVEKDVDACLDYLSKDLGINPSNVAAIGFCWGVWALTKACAMGTPFRCAVGFHPSLRFEEMFGGDVVAMTKMAARSTPLFYCVSGNDAEYLKPPNGEVSVVLSTSGHGDSGDEKVCPRCVEFAEMNHGWVSRGDTSVNKVRDDAEMALTLSTHFLRHWM